MDRVLCDVEWDDNYPLTTVCGVGTELSDHVPLFVWSGDLPRLDPIFKFENAWLIREGIDEIVTETWRTNGIKGSKLDRWQNKIRALRAKLKGWNRNMNAWYRDLKKLILTQLDEIDKTSELFGLLTKTGDILLSLCTGIW